MVKNRVVRKDQLPAGYKPMGESGGHPKQSYERPKKIQWVRQEDQPMLELLTEIRDLLKQLLAKP